MPVMGGGNSGDSGGATHYNFGPITIVAKDAGSFVNSDQQIKSTLRRAMAAAAPRRGA